MYRHANTYKPWIIYEATIRFKDVNGWCYKYINTMISMQSTINKLIIYYNYNNNLFWSNMFQMSLDLSSCSLYKLLLVPLFCIPYFTNELVHFSIVSTVTNSLLLFVTCYRLWRKLHNKNIYILGNKTLTKTHFFM